MSPPRTPPEEREAVEEPALGWELAPEVTSSSENSREEAEERLESSRDARDLEKIKTQPDNERGATPNAAKNGGQGGGPPASVGFWNWQMVRQPQSDLGKTMAELRAGWSKAPCLKAMAPHE